MSRIEPNVAIPIQEGVCALPYKRIKTLDAQHAIAVLEARHLLPELVWGVPDIMHILPAALTHFGFFVMLGYCSAESLLHQCLFSAPLSPRSNRLEPSLPHHLAQKPGPDPLPMCQEGDYSCLNCSADKQE